MKKSSALIVLPFMKEGALKIRSGPEQLGLPGKTFLMATSFEKGKTCTRYVKQKYCSVVLACNNYEIVDFGALMVPQRR